MVKLYVLGNKETGIHFSPFAWRAIAALKFKKIDYELEVLELSEVGPKISELTGGKWKLIPVVQFDDGKIFYESFDIAVELEKRYPASKLFPGGISNAKFYEAYFMGNLISVFKRVIPNMLKVFNDEDKQLFRKSREASFKQTLEQFTGDADSLLKTADVSFDPLRAALKHAPFVEGQELTYSDIIFLGGFQWIRITSPDDFDLYVTNHTDSVLKNWYHACDEKLGGILTSAKSVKDIQ